MDYKIRELKQNEISVLNTFLYEAIFVPDGVDAQPYEIINQPELQVYVTDFGKKKSGIMEEGKFVVTEEGSIQGNRTGETGAT